MMTTPHSLGPVGDNDGEDAPARPTLSLRQWWWVAAGLIALVAIASWVGWTQARQPVRWQEVGFEIESPTRASVTFDVYVYTDSPVTCYVRALNSRFAEVGVGSQVVDPARGTEQRLTTTMATVEEATTAVVRYCAPD